MAYRSGTVVDDGALHHVDVAARYFDAGRFVAKVLKDACPATLTHDVFIRKLLVRSGEFVDPTLAALNEDRVTLP